jgi:CRP-like cAMP-binding protein
MLSMTRSLPDWKGAAETRVFDDRLLVALRNALQERALLHYPARRVIMKEDEGGVFMYVVLKGKVAISIGPQVVERVGPGGVFGEMALVEQSTRAASAVAETDCALLPINRNDILDVMRSKLDIGLSLLRAVAERLRHMDTGYK